MAMNYVSIAYVFKNTQTEGIRPLLPEVPGPSYDPDVQAANLFLAINRAKGNKRRWDNVSHVASQFQGVALCTPQKSHATIKQCRHYVNDPHESFLPAPIIRWHPLRNNYDTLTSSHNTHSASIGAGKNRFAKILFRDDTQS
jgi:hypothetical protein